MLVYKTLGFFFLGLAAIGVFLPILPTTPFLLVAAGCFAKSSAEWHRWLLANRLFGPMIRNWQEKKCISYPTKILAIASIVLFGGSSILFGVAQPNLKLFGTFLMAAGLFFVCRLRVCNSGSHSR